TLMQNIAAENNLSETAFFVGADGSYDLRWFTPVTEVDLCGHATLASGYVIFNELEPHLEEARFSTRSGELVVRRNNDELVMDFPSQPPAPCVVPPGLTEGLRSVPSEVLASADLLAVFENEAQVRAIKPKFSMLKRMPFRGVIATAPGDDCDFVSRFFAPNVGVDEDPVTGSAHCALAPYWAQRLDKPELLARQVSSRGGTLHCAVDDERVFIAGRCAEYLKGEISLAGIRARSV
ncbi:MAG: PhzF family phenazine biosynthesis protein, partial [Desulfuromonadales bacterium]|nr:PhzF family phenazine biosynthesis protein [Desulfuromonadales bacterium]NIS43717.1 PhzF family phenazine biosynthesis protein [Desulfuromonadales bacterium]